MEKEMNITFEGVKLEIRKMERPELKGIYAKDILSFDFYEAKYKDYEFLLTGKATIFSTRALH